MEMIDKVKVDINTLKLFCQALGTNLYYFKITRMGKEYHTPLNAD